VQIQPHHFKPFDCFDHTGTGKGASVANLREHLIGAERFRFAVRAQ